MTTGKLLAVLKPEEALQLKGNSEVVIFDVRTGPGIKEIYLGEHLAGARFIDADHDLAAHTDDASKGGRHPLPSAATFAKLMASHGVSTNSHVLVYDDKNGANAAARLWWMLRAIGHDNVQVIDGGYDAAKAAGYPTTSGEAPRAVPATYEAAEWLLPTVDLEYVKVAAKDPATAVIDVRDERRYRGEVEPIDLVAGHIPGAVNLPFVNNLDNSGFFLPPNVLREKYMQSLQGISPEKVVVHCGSGITACHTLLAMDYAGLAIPKLYVGSWSEWSRNDLPIGKGNE